MKRTIPKVGPDAKATARGELIGLEVRVVESRDPGLVGLTGTVVDETLRTFIVRRVDGRESRVGKVESVFEFQSPAGAVRIAGAALEFRPEDRTKKVK